MACIKNNSMPVLENVQVSLNEVLEVRGQSLEEWELWGVLFQTTEAVQDIFLRGHACKDGIPQYLVTPDNSFCTSMGRIVLNACAPETISGTKYWCSEMAKKDFYSNNSDLEKTYAFTIGQTMLHAAYFGVQDKYEKKLSPLFKTVLQSMSQTDTDLRMVLSDISEVCRFHAYKHMRGYSFLKSIISLHREVLGSLPENEILNQVDQDVMRENETEVNLECEPEDLMDVNYDTKNFSYGHRLGYHPELSASVKSTKKAKKMAPKEWWKKAYHKIVEEIRKSKLPPLDKEKIMEEWKKHKAHQTIFRVYEELTERRKMLELLRLSINIGPSSPVDVDKNPLLMTGLKPKTIAELVLLLQRPPKQPVIGSASSDVAGCSSESSNVTSGLPHPIGDGSYDQPYYALHKVISKIPLKASDINSLPGPQFVIGRLKSHMRISLLPSDSLEYQSSIVNLSILLLTGESIDVECLHSTSGKQLFQAVADHIKLQERYLFGLACETGGEYIFIERKQKLVDFLQGCTSSPAPIHSFQLLFRVKFYIDDVHLMRTQSLRHLFYLQLRKDFLNDDFCLDIKFALTLGGLALQAEFGDYDSFSYGKEYFLLEHYLPFQCIKQINRNETKTKLQNHHSDLRGISKELSELKFIQNMMQAAEYGCHFHKVLQDKRNISSAVWLGIKPKGIEVYEIISGKRSVCQNYPWQNILRISFSKKCFCLVPRTESITGKHIVYRFYTSVLHRSLYLFNIAMAHHKFFLKLKSVTKASEIFFEDFDAENFYVINKSGIEKEVSCDLYDSEGNLQLKAPKTSKYRNSGGKGTSLKKASFTDLTNLQMFKNLLPCIEDVIILSSKGSGRIKKKKKYPNIVMRSSSDPVKKDHSYLSGRIFSAKDLSSCVPTVTIRDESSRNPDLKFMRLHKDVKCGLGMVITCGDSCDTILHGAFVESVHPGSPADLDGNICPGDQIMSVNGTNVQNDYFLTVVDLIQCSNTPVDLVVAKTGKSSPDNPRYPTKEIIEEPFTKSKAWLVGDEKSDTSKKIEDNSCVTEMPIPKPRKKLTQRKSCEQPQLDGPDLTLNHLKQSTVNKSWNNESDSNVIDDHLYSKNWSIPDIIASQIKCVDSSEFCQIPKCIGKNEDLENISINDIDKNDLLPGEVYHVVLDKKGGSLGLNIFQGTETSSSLQKHIYIHSIIPNGAAKLDGRIKPGDKLLEVNGILLEDLTYQEVVTTLRESPQVTHLVLEKGASFPNKTEEQDNFQSGFNSLPHKTDLLVSTEDEKKTNIHAPPQNGLFNNKPEMISKVHKGIDAVDSHCLTKNLFESYHTDDRNSFSSLPTSIESSLNCAKETSSAPSSYQHSDHLKNREKSSISSCDDLDVSRNSNDSFSSQPHAKDDNRFKNGLTSYKSTPNLADSSDEEENRNGSRLYRNQSTDCLLYSPHFMNPHQALFDLYQNYAYIRGSSCNIHQIPAVPIRKKKLKKLEDIYNYCNIENTFIVTIRKSSRGLGLSISGGKDASRKDPFSQLIQIRKLYPLQPALECGKLALGDVILEVNGVSMLGLTNTEALEVLRSAPQDVVLKVFRPSKSLIPSFSVFKGGIWPGFNSSSSSASSSLSRTENNSYNVETGEFEVTLMKRDGSLGFTISKKDNCHDSPEGIYVKALVREHAVSDGRIQPGDRILQVNGTDVSSLSHSEALTCLRNTSDKVTLKLYRDDPPLTPANFDDNYTISKPLRREAVELLNDRVKQKDMNDENNTMKRKIKRKLDRCSNAPSTASSESASSTSSSSGQEHVIDDSEMLANLADELSLEGVGLQRNQRPKSLDVLNSSDRKRFIGHSEEDSFHRQSSVMCPNADSKAKNESDESNSNSGKSGGKNLLKWRGSTLPDSEETSSIDTIQENSVMSPKSLNVARQISSENKSDEDDCRPVPFPRTTSYSNEWVHTFDVSLDRGWHLRLGFSVCDPPETDSSSLRHALPSAAEVKAVYPSSLAEKDGRIKVGDRIVEVNGESLLGKSAHEVIDILRKTRGVIRMVFCRLETRS